MFYETLKEKTYYKYNELCSLLGLEAKNSSTNSKRAQEKIISTFVDFEKVGTGKGTKYLVTKIHPVQKKKEDKRELGNNNIISIHIQYSLLCLLNNIKKQDDNREYIGLNKFYIFKSLGMTNEIFCSEFINRSDITTIEFFSYTHQRLYSRLNDALRSFVKKSNDFTVSQGYRFYTKDSLGALKYKTADKDEEKLIIAVENYILKELGLKNKKALLFTKHANESTYPDFKRKVVNHLRRNFPLYFAELENYSEAIVFGYTKSAILNTKNKFENDYKFDYGLSEDTIKQSLNNLIINSLNGTIKRRHLKAKKEKDQIATLNPMEKKLHIYRSSSTYVEDQTKIINSVIKIKTGQINFQEYLETKKQFI